MNGSPNIPNIPNPEDQRKYEVPEQENLTLGQAKRVESWLKLSQLLDTLAKLLGTINIGDVAADVATTSDISVINRTDFICDKWKGAYRIMQEHMSKVIELSDAQKKAMQEIVMSLERCKKLPNDRLIEERLTSLNRLLDDLEKHRKSGLLEAISKL